MGKVTSEMFRLTEQETSRARVHISNLSPLFPNLFSLIMIAMPCYILPHLTQTLRFHCWWRLNASTALFFCSILHPRFLNVGPNCKGPNAPLCQNSLYCFFKYFYLKRKRNANLPPGSFVRVTSKNTCNSWYILTLIKNMLLKKKKHVVYLKSQFNWASYLLSGHPMSKRRVGNLKAEVI